jgi:hypothetical protein
MHGEMSCNKVSRGKGSQNLIFLSNILGSGSKITRNYKLEAKKKAFMKQIHFEISPLSSPSSNGDPLAFGLNEGMGLRS